MDENKKVGESTTSETLKIIFTLDNDKTTTVNVKDPKTGLTQAEVIQVAEAMINKEALIVGGSPIADLKNCYIEKITRTELA